MCDSSSDDMDFTMPIVSVVMKPFAKNFFAFSTPRPSPSPSPSPSLGLRGSLLTKDTLRKVLNNILPLIRKELKSCRRLGELLNEVSHQLVAKDIPRDVLLKILPLTMRVNLCAEEKVLPEEEDLNFALDLFTEIAGCAYEDEDEDMTLGSLLMDLSRILVTTTIPRDALNTIWELTVCVKLYEIDKVIPMRRHLLFARDLFGEISTHAGVDGSDVQRIIDELIARQTMEILARIDAKV